MFEAFIFGTFFLASAGASAAYLTVSEIFPMETRALAIAFFYAVGTGIGGIAGPLLFGNLIGSKNRDEVAVAFYIGAAVMAIGGVVELLFGVKAEQQTLEDIAKPLTAEDAEQGEGAEQGPTRGEQHRDERREERRPTRARQRAERERSGRRRYRPGPSETATPTSRRGCSGTSLRSAARSGDAPRREVERDRSRGRRGRRPSPGTSSCALVGRRRWGPAASGERSTRLWRPADPARRPRPVRAARAGRLGATLVLVELHHATRF